MICSSSKNQLVQEDVGEPLIDVVDDVNDQIDKRQDDKLN